MWGKVKIFTLEKSWKNQSPSASPTKKRLNWLKTKERAFANCNMYNDKSLLPSCRSPAIPHHQLVYMVVGPYYAPLRLCIFHGTERNIPAELFRYKIRNGIVYTICAVGLHH